MLLHPHVQISLKEMKLFSLNRNYLLPELANNLRHLKCMLIRGRGLIPAAEWFYDRLIRERFQVQTPNKYKVVSPLFPPLPLIRIAVNMSVLIDLTLKSTLNMNIS